MKKTIFIFLSGLFLGGIVVAPLLYVMVGDYRMKNSSQEYYEGRLSVIAALEKEFGSIPYSDKGFEKVVIGAKTTEVVSVYKDGVKTIKVTSF